MAWACKPVVTSPSDIIVEAPSAQSNRFLLVAGGAGRAELALAALLAAADRRGLTLERLAGLAGHVLRVQALVRLLDVEVALQVVRDARWKSGSG